MRTRARAERADSVRHGNWRTSVARNRALIRLFLRRCGIGQSQYVNVTMRSSATDSIRYAVRGNFAGSSFGWPVCRSHEPLQSLHVIKSFSRSTRPSVSIAHLYVHAASTQKKRSPNRTTRMSYPMISKCFFPPSGTSSILHRLTCVSIGRGEPPPGLKSLEPHGLPTEEECEAATQQARGRSGRRRGRHSEDDAVDPLDVDSGLGRERLVRRRLPEFPAVPHVALLPGTQALDYGRGLPNHLADDRSAVPDLLHLVHREQQESAEEARRD